MLAVGFILSILSSIGLIIAIVWLVVTLVSENKVSRRNALKMLVISALGLLISFPLCTIGWSNTNIH